eukprot:jgi/Psemu1/39191/gm1.39191_g
MEGMGAYGIGPVLNKSHGCGLFGEALWPGEKVVVHEGTKEGKYHVEVQSPNQSCGRRKRQRDGP